MIINFLGDSITQGAGASCRENQYVSLVGQMLGCKSCNYGVGGTRIAKVKTPSVEALYDYNFLQRAENMAKGDLVFVFGGTNDYGHGTDELGEMSVENKDAYTFVGAINNLIDYLLETYTKENIVFILPLHRYGEDSHYGEFGEHSFRPVFQEYVSAQREILEKRGIKYLDFNEYFPIPKTCQGDDLTVDGLHPNDKGHKLLASLICDYVKTR